jgi:Uma2 family endonuclease
MGVSSEPVATLDDLARTEGKAELIGGKIVQFRANGYKPARVVGRIARGLEEFAERAGRGEAFTSTLGFAIPTLPSGRQSFCADAGFYAGPLPQDRMGFIEGPPTLAVEVRNQGDYGPVAERERAAKRADYFAAGSVVVWDVDVLAEVVRVYRAADPLQPTSYTSGQSAEAVPAVPGWNMAVDWIFG